VKRGLRDATGRGVLTSLTRMAGWSAHRMEELGQGGKIIRPATKCVEKRRAYASMDER
jgi:citrate synthase